MATTCGITLKGKVMVLLPRYTISLLTQFLVE